MQLRRIQSAPIKALGRGAKHNWPIEEEAKGMRLGRAGPCQAKSAGRAGAEAQAQAQAKLSAQEL